jgi:septum formation protein
MDDPGISHFSLPLRTRPDGARYWCAADLTLPEGAAGAPVVLASVSPRRRELLRRAGICFRDFDPGEDPPLAHLEDWPAACLRAVHKAGRGARAGPGRLSLGADTVVVYGGHTLGKPQDEEEARRMLGMLSGRAHLVYTAFCLAHAERSIRVLWLEVVRTEVRFRSLGPEEIAAYVAGGAPLDKAGAYGIQDRGHRLVESIRGSYYNVVGLPVRQVGAALRRVGWQSR